MKFDMKEFGKRVAARRKQLGIKQNILAEKLDISNNHMSGIENGKERPSIELFVAICDSLNVTPDYLLLGNMHSDNVPKSISNLLRLCTDEDIEVIKRMAQHIVNVRHNAEKSDK